MARDMTADEPRRGGFGTPGQNELLSMTHFAHEKSRREDVDQDHLGFQPGGRNYAFALLMKSRQVHGKKSGYSDRSLVSANVVRHSSGEQRQQPSAADVLAARIIQSSLELSNRLALVTAPEIRDPDPPLSEEPTMDCIVSPKPPLSNEPTADCIVSDDSHVETEVDPTGCNSLDEAYASAWKGVAIVGSGLVGWCSFDALKTGSLAFTKNDADKAKPSRSLSPIETLHPTAPNVVASAETTSHTTATDAIMDAIEMAREEANALAADTAVIIDSINLSDAFEMAHEEAALLMAEAVANVETTAKVSEWGIESGMGPATSPSGAIRDSQENEETIIATTTENLESTAKTMATGTEPAGDESARLSAGPAQAQAESLDPTESDDVLLLNEFPPQVGVQSSTTSMSSLLTE